MTDYKYAIGARVTVRDGTTLFHTRTQAFTRGTDIYFALLTIPYKDEEDLLVRANCPDWDSWEWNELAKIAEGCRWRGPKLDARWIN